MLPLMAWVGSYSQPKRRKQGVVILTKIPIADRVKSDPTSLQYFGLKNACFLERIMTESMAHTLTELRAQMEAESKQRSSCDDGSARRRNQRLELFVCYKLNYTCSYEIKDWLEHLPDYSRRFDIEQAEEHQLRQRYQALQTALHHNANQRDTISDPDSYCANCPEKEPLDDNRVFHYVSVQGRDFNRLLEVSFRAAFSRGCRDVIVVNPHAIGLTSTHIRDALWALGGQRPSTKNDVVIGRSRQGGVYLIGVACRREVLLRLRRLTTDLVWGSRGLHAKLLGNLGRLGWQAVSLREQLDEVDSVDSLPLVEHNLRIPMEHLVHDDITVVVPTLNNEDLITQTMETLVQNVSKRRRIQIIVIDGRSTDDTLAKLESFKRRLHHYLRATSVLSTASALVPAPRVSRAYTMPSNITRRDSATAGLANSPLVTMEICRLPDKLTANRGEQVRYAVKEFAKGAALLILRPGTHLPIYWDTTLLRCLDRLGVVLGSFSYHLYLHDKYIQRKNIPWAIRCYLMNFLTNYRSVKYELPLGDQALFTYTYYYHLLGGYPPFALLDDVALIDRARLAGHVGISQAPVTVLPKRALCHGFLRVAVLDHLVLLAYRLGADPDQLDKYHRGMGIIAPDYLDGY